MTIPFFGPLYSLERMKIVMSRSGIAWAPALALSLLTASCGQCGRSPDRAAIEPLVFGLQERLKPDGGTVTAFSGLHWDHAGVHASWEIETGMDWSAYSAWVKQRLPVDFRSDAVDGSSVVLRKSMPGDFYVLRFEPIASASPPRVRATFDGYPN